MAEQMTQIAQELDRIEYAKGLIGASAEAMMLTYIDDENRTHNVSAHSPIEIIADAIDNIEVYHGSEIDVEEQRPAEGVVVEKDAVTVKKGYHAYTQVAKIEPGNVPGPTISVDANTGVITASVTPDEGYVYEIEKTSTQTISHENLKNENIKANTKVFGVTGTFTSDANVPTTGNDDIIYSSHITKDFTAYKNGKMVMGTLENHDGPEQFNNFNPLETENWVLEGPVRIGGSLTVGLSNDLLNRLKAI